ncbi:MAG TPA: hypothetical protein VJJ81_02840 [Candidatus Babeliales bacterium]|nr:hypothetical protein [Candidatus Babeliales bacterium]
MKNLNLYLIALFLLLGSQNVIAMGDEKATPAPVRFDTTKPELEAALDQIDLALVKCIRIKYSKSVLPSITDCQDNHTADFTTTPYYMDRSTPHYKSRSVIFKALRSETEAGAECLIDYDASRSRIGEDGASIRSGGFIGIGRGDMLAAGDKEYAILRKLYERIGAMRAPVFEAYTKCVSETARGGTWLRRHSTNPDIVKCRAALDEGVAKFSQRQAAKH